MLLCRCECPAAMQLVLGRLAATQSATPLTLSPFVDRPFLTDLLLPHNFGRPGSAARAAALKSGRRPRGRRPWHCRRPSVVTEGYIRLPPLPPTTSCQFQFTPGSRPVHDYTCNLQCILRVVFKKHRFLQGFVAFAVSRFHLGDVKKPWVFHGFGSSDGVRNGKLDILTALVPT